MEKLKIIGKQFKREVEIYRRLLSDQRVPSLSRWLLWLAVAYAISPIDLIPDFIPVIGHLDDIIILPLLVWLALRSIPGNLILEHRENIKQRFE